MDKTELIFLIFKIVMTVILFATMTIAEPNSIYIVGMAVIVTGVIVLTFAFIKSVWASDNESEDTE